MKKFLILLMLVITFAFSNDIVLTKEDVIVKDGITINKATNQPFTGILIWYSENFTFKDVYENGIMNGIAKNYDKKGVLRGEVLYITDLTQ